MIFLAAAILMAATVSAQNCIVVNSEKVFKSIAEYNTAIADLDRLAEQYQTQVDARFAEVETLYNSYVSQKASLSASVRQMRENAILQKEKEANAFQESTFGTDGTIMKKRLEMMAPIQKRVFAAIEAYAKAKGIDIVIDSASNATLLYNSTAVERTQEIINALK